MGVQFAGNILVQSNGGPLPIANGGTGQTSATAALTALLPSQSGQSGKALVSNGTLAAWQNISGSPGGSDTAIQYNDAGQFGGASFLTINKSTGAVTSTSTLTNQGLVISKASATTRPINFQTTGSNRWILQANATAESGSNAGSDFQLIRIADNGATQNTVYTISRATGVMDFTAAPTVSGVPIGSNNAAGTTGSIQLNNGSNSFTSGSGFTWASNVLSIATANATATITGGDNTTTGPASNLVVRGGFATGSNADGGSLYLQGGTPGSAGAAVSPGQAGDVFISGATGGANAITTTNGGDVSISGGLSGSNAASGSGGAIYFTTAPRNNGAFGPVERLRITALGEWQLAGSTGSSGQVLTSGGAGTAPTWANAAAGTVTSVGVSSNGTYSGSITIGASPVTSSGTITITPNVFTSTTPGVAPLSGGGTSNFLRADGTWAVPTTGAAAAGSLTGTTLAANVVSSSLTSVGTLSSLAVTGTTTHTGATNLAGASSPLQVGGSAGTSGQVLTSAGAGATPTWTSAGAAAAGSLTGTTLAANVVNSSLTSVGSSLTSGSGLTGQTLQAYTGGNYASIYSTNITPSATNFTLAHNGSQTFLNAPVQVGINVSNSVVALVTSTGLGVTGTLSFTSALLANGSAGSANQVLTSAGAGSPPTWGSPTVTTLSGTGALTFNAATLATNSGTYAGAVASQGFLSFFTAGATANNRYSDIYADAAGSTGTIHFRLGNDAMSTQTDWLTVTRSTTTASNITLAGTKVTLTAPTIDLSLGTNPRVLLANGVGTVDTRTLFTSSTTNGYSSLGIAGNGTSPLADLSTVVGNTGASNTATGLLTTNYTYGGIQTDTSAANSGTAGVGPGIKLTAGFAGTGVKPGIIFLTTPTTAGTLVEQMRIAPTGEVGLGTSGASGGLLPQSGVRLNIHEPTDAIVRVKWSNSASGNGATTQGFDIIMNASTGSSTPYQTQFIHRMAGAALGFFTNPVANTGTVERFRIGSAGDWLIAGTSAGTSGQVFTSGGAGAAPSWTTLSVSTLANISTMGTNNAAVVNLGGIASNANATPVTIFSGVAASGAGNDMTLRGGHASAGQGGVTNIFSGTGGGANNGGAINITSGDTSAAGGVAGAITIASDSAIGKGATVTVRGGNTPQNSTAGGSLILAGGNSTNATTSGAGGPVTITAGSTVTSGSTAGAVTITGGSSGSGTAGGVTISGGAKTVGTGGKGGTVSINGGTGIGSGAGNAGGDILLTAGINTTGNGGSFAVSTGASASVERMRITPAGNVSVGTASLATNATDGFPYIPTCAGTPTGTPTAITGFAPLVIDSTNNKMYFYAATGTGSPAWIALN